jgi:hypothetical protein
MISQKTNPIQSQFKPNLSQNKPKTNPIKANFKAKQTQLERSASPERTCPEQGRRSRRIIKRNAPLHKQPDLLQLKDSFVTGRLKSPLANQNETSLRKVVEKC